MDFNKIYKLNEADDYDGDFGDLDDNDNEIAFDIKYDDASEIMKKAVLKIGKMFGFSNLSDDRLSIVADEFVEKLISMEEDVG